MADRDGALGSLEPVEVEAIPIPDGPPLISSATKARAEVLEDLCSVVREKVELWFGSPEELPWEKSEPFVNDRRWKIFMDAVVGSSLEVFMVDF